MRFQCTEWVEGFTVGAIYSAVYKPGTSYYHLVDDDGIITKFPEGELLLHFEEV